MKKNVIFIKEVNLKKKNLKICQLFIYTKYLLEITISAENQDAGDLFYKCWNWQKISMSNPNIYEIQIKNELDVSKDLCIKTHNP